MKGTGSVWFWLSVVALLVGIAYIVVVHPVVLAALVVVGVGLALCGVSWVLGE